MSDLIAPHGGLLVPVNRTVSPDRQAEFQKEIASLPAFPVSDADLSSVYRLGDGGLSPLTGPMVKDVYDRVLSDVNILVNGKKYAWSIPISLPATKEVAATLKPGKRVKLVNAAGQAVGVLHVDDIFLWDKSAYIEGVYQTKRTDHPGGRMVMSDPGEFLVGGEVEVLPQPKHPEYGKYVLRP
ncbi:MAG: sulfate adenylyltransferase, partial [Phycisphaerae bacterium]|nr:sulfate adenylyltransferase [Phycisphaerae bacterium]